LTGPAFVNKFFCRAQLYLSHVPVDIISLHWRRAALFPLAQPERGALLVLLPP
jgi:hypothetical protein